MGGLGTRMFVIARRGERQKRQGANVETNKLFLIFYFGILFSFFRKICLFGVLAWCFPHLLFLGWMHSVYAWCCVHHAVHLPYERRRRANENAKKGKPQDEHRTKNTEFLKTRTLSYFKFFIFHISFFFSSVIVICWCAFLVCSCVHMLLCSCVLRAG